MGPVPRLSQLNFNEILLYMRHRGQTVTEELRDQIRSCEKEILAQARPKTVWRELPLDDDLCLADSGFALEGEDIRNLLCGCGRVILFAATLGPDVDVLIRRSQITDMGRALILDACAGAAIENLCDNFQRDMEQVLAETGEYLTDRYSPGYGNFPLEHQGMFCRLLDTGRKIGLAVTSAQMLTPCKSVTAVIGISDSPRPRRRPGCETCRLFQTCQFRKEGMTCYG